LPEFDVGVLTVRSGTRVIRVTADDDAAARSLLQAECDTNQSHCPPEWCTDNVESTVLDVRRVVLDGVTIIAAGVGFGTLYADDSLRRKQAPRA
jgi:hypothetical protein